MIRFEPTKNRRLIKEIVISPEIWPHVIDDSLTDPDLFNVPIDDRQFIWVVVYEEDIVLGMFMVQRINFVTYEVHTMLLKAAHGMSFTIGHGALHWAFENIDNCKRIITQVPEFNKLADRLCRTLKLEFIGVNRKSYQMKGQLYDVKWYGISKEDIVCP